MVKYLTGYLSYIVILYVNKTYIMKFSLIDYSFDFQDRWILILGSSGYYSSLQCLLLDHDHRLQLVHNHSELQRPTASQSEPQRDATTPDVPLKIAVALCELVLPQRGCSLFKFE